MTSMERRGRLTYDRLINSLGKLHGAIGGQLPDHKDAARVQDIQRAVNNALTAARAGMNGTSDASPAQLKQEVKMHIADIHERHDAIEEAGVRTRHSTQTSKSISSAAIGKDKLSSTTSYHTPAPKRTRGARDSSKENAVLPAAPSAQPPARKISAIRKTPITKRPTTSKPSTNSGIKKRSTRTTRSKTATQDVTAAPLLSTDDSDRRAAAAALLGLSEHSPETSFTSFTPSSSAITPSTTSSKKRTYSVYTEDTSLHPLPPSQDPVSSSSAPKRRMLTSTFAPVPLLAKGLSTPEVFALGVEYALQHFNANGEEEGEAMRAWVEEQLGLHTPLQVHSIHRVNGISAAAISTASGAAPASSNVVNSDRKGFWDVI